MNETSEFARLFFILTSIVGIPLIIYYAHRLYKATKKERILANWDDIKDHISLDELKKKIQRWKEEGYNVDELEQMIGFIRK